jgi:hypothetical protein
MAAADITVNENWATIECDTTKRVITNEGVGGSLVNIGTTRVYLGMGIDTLAKTDAQRDGEIYLDQNDSIPVPAQARWFIPKIG